MTTLNSSAGLKLDNILVATDLSAASKAALLYAIPIARRHEAKLGKRAMSASARSKIAAAQRRRWAKFRQKGNAA